MLSLSIPILCIEEVYYKLTRLYFVALINTQDRLIILRNFFPPVFS